MTPELELRHVSLNDLETRLDEGEDGTFSGYANLHEVTDTYQTRFAAGSWRAGGLNDEPFALLFMHDPMRPVGTFTASEDARGLRIQGKYDDTQAGRDARIMARSGSAPELSVGFIRRDVDPDDETRITAAELHEVSVITRRMAAQRGAELTAIRAAATLVRQAEQGQDPVLCTQCGTRVSDDATETPEPEASVTEPPEGEPQVNEGEQPVPDPDTPDSPDEEEVPEVDDSFELDDSMLTDEALPAEDEGQRDAAPNKSSVPGSNAAQLKNYWTKGAGLAKWADKPHPWTALYHHLLKYIKNPEEAKATAAKWYKEVKGHTPNQKVTKSAGLDPETRRRKVAEARIRLGEPVKKTEEDTSSDGIDKRMADLDWGLY